jgi:hypothetical protein
MHASLQSKCHFVEECNNPILKQHPRFHTPSSIHPSKKVMFIKSLIVKYLIAKLHPQETFHVNCFPALGSICQINIIYCSDDKASDYRLS